MLSEFDNLQSDQKNLPSAQPWSELALFEFYFNLNKFYRNRLIFLYVKIGNSCT